MTGPTTGHPGPALAVLAPAPLLTVTIEARTDQPEVHLHVGGQGYWIARLSTELGADVTLCATIGGETGAIVACLLGQSGLSLRTIATQGANGTYVHDRRGGARRVVVDVPAVPLDRHEVDDLFGAALGSATGCGTLVLAGMPTPGLLPEGFYRRLAASAQAAGVRVVADTSGATMREVLAGGVDVLKVSDDELRDAGRLPADPELATLTTAMKQLQADGAASVVLTRAERGTMVLGEGELFELTAPTMEVVESAGAGDSLTAALGVTLATSGTVLEGARLGTAAAALNVTRHGLGSGRRHDIEALSQRVSVEALGR